MLNRIKIIYFLFLGLSLLLAFYPALDIEFSKLFYKGKNQFVVQHYLVSWVYFYEYVIRDILMPLIVIFLLFFPIIIKFSDFLKVKFSEYNIRISDIIYIWISTAVVAFVVSHIFKNNWGRARPVDTIFFGGDKNFSSWIEYSTECIDNCSFVSGDASVGFFVSCLYFVTGKKKFFYLSVFLGAIIGITRIGAGGHFLSDVLMSFVLVNFILFVNHYFYSKWKKINP